MSTRKHAPGWLPDEEALGGRENFDPDHVARYDGKMDAEAESEVALLRRLGLTASSSLIEYGPGTGQFTVAATPHCARLIAVDVSRPMLDALQRKLSAAGLQNVDTVRAGFLSYRHEGQPVDFAYSRFALHHLPDFWKAVAMRRVRSAMRTGGVVRLWDVVYSFPLAEAEARLEAWCATGGDSVDGDWSRAEIEEHVRDEHSTFAWLLEPMIQQAGFAIEAAETSPEGFEVRYVLRAV